MIYLIRHGETDWNTDKRIQGREDIPLNTFGFAQAAALKDAFHDVPLDFVASSPLMRAYQTAEITAQDHGLSVRIEPDLIERDFGSLSGQSYIARDSAEALHGKDPYDDMEPISVVRDRVMYVIRRYAASDYKNICLVSHGATIKAVLRALTEDDLSRERMWLKNSCINIIDTGERGELKLLAYNLDAAEFESIKMSSQPG